MRAKCDVCKEDGRVDKFKRRDLRRQETWKETMVRYIEGEPFKRLVTRSKSVAWKSEFLKPLDSFRWTRKARICRTCQGAMDS